MPKTTDIKRGNDLLATYQEVGKFWTGIYQEKKLAHIAKQLPFQFNSFQEMKTHVEKCGFTLDPDNQTTEV